MRAKCIGGRSGNLQVDQKSKSGHGGTTDVTRQCLQGKKQEKIHQNFSERAIHQHPAATSLQGTSRGICAASCISKPGRFQALFTNTDNEPVTVRIKKWVA